MPNGYYLTHFDIPTPTIVLGPKASIETAFIALTPAQMSMRGRYIWGWAKYTDTIERKNHITRFCYALEGWEGNPVTPIGEAAAPLLLSVEKQLAAQAQVQGQPSVGATNGTAAGINPQLKATFLSLLPFRPIFGLCSEGNCRDEECTEQAKPYNARQ